MVLAGGEDWTECSGKVLALAGADWSKGDGMEVAGGAERTKGGGMVLVPRKLTATALLHLTTATLRTTV